MWLARLSQTQEDGFKFASGAVFRAKNETICGTHNADFVANSADFVANSALPQGHSYLAKNTINLKKNNSSNRKNNMP